MAIAIPGREIHLPVNACRIRAQSLLDQTQGFHERLPVHCAQETKAGNAVADGNPVGCLILAFLLDQMLDG